MIFRSIVVVVVVWSGGAFASGLPEPAYAAIERHCFDCHDDLTSKGELDLFSLEYDLADPDNRATWVRVFDRVEKGEMPPPEKADRFPGEERKKLLASLKAGLVLADENEIAAIGRGPVRRLTRAEYEDNLRDLLKLPRLDVGDKLPEDRTSHGFTKVSELLDMSHVQMDAYLDASEAALMAAVATSLKPEKPKVIRFTGTDLFPALTTFGDREAMFFARDGKLVPISNEAYKAMTPEERRDTTLELAIFRSATWPYYGYPRGFRATKGGDYRVRFSARAVRQVPDFRLVPAYDPQPMSFRSRQPSGPDVSGDVQETGGWMDLQPEAKEFETTIQLKAGETFEYSLLGLPVPFIRTDGGFFYDFPPMPPEGHRGGAIQWLEVEGPIVSSEWPPESHRVLFGDLPLGEKEPGSQLPVSIRAEDPDKDAVRLFRRFADTATRSPLAEADYAPFLELIRSRLKSGTPFGDAMLTGYQAFLCSGHFLYLKEPNSGDSFALAQQLSHFLWNSRPDPTLLKLAEEGTLRQPETLSAETDRLIADEKFERFIDQFAGQWLDLRQLRRDVPDNRLYPEYRKDDYVIDSMEKETLVFLTAMFRENLPAVTMVDSDFTYVNDRLARHYDLPRVAGSAMRKVQLPDWSPYGGLLTQASILKLTSNGTTTSPVLRGVWVMEKILGDPPPPPPKTVPAIKPDIRGATTIRDLLGKHTEVKSCANCHARFDPVGFALENFDVMGAWRDRYRGLEKGDKITGVDPAGHPFVYYVGPEVDAAGALRSGEAFSDIRELKRLLAEQPRQLARNLLYQLTLYATGVEVRFFERDEIEAILDRCAGNGYRVRDLMKTLIASRIFVGSPTSPTP